MSMLRRRLMMPRDGGINPNAYIDFADATLGGILAEKYGDGTGLTYAQAAAVTSFPDWGIGINDRSDIASFNELNYFTGLQTIGHICFRNTPNMVIDDLRLPALVRLGGHVFQNSGVRKVSDLGNLSSFYSWDYGYTFDGCAQLTEVTIPDTLVELGSRMMGACNKLTYVDLGAGVTSIKEYNFLQNDTALSVLLVRAQTCVTCSANGFMEDVPTTCKIYVPDELVDTYKMTSPWSTRAGQIYPLSDYTG